MGVESIVSLRLRAVALDAVQKKPAENQPTTYSRTNMLPFDTQLTVQPPPLNSHGLIKPTTKTIAGAMCWALWVFAPPAVGFGSRCKHSILEGHQKLTDQPTVWANPSQPIEWRVAILAQSLWISCQGIQA